MPSKRKFKLPSRSKLRPNRKPQKPSIRPTAPKKSPVNAYGDWFRRMMKVDPSVLATELSKPEASTKIGGKTYLERFKAYHNPAFIQRTVRDSDTDSLHGNLDYLQSIPAKRRQNEYQDLIKQIETELERRKPSPPKVPITKPTKPKKALPPAGKGINPSRPRKVQPSKVGIRTGNNPLSKLRSFGPLVNKK